MSLSLRVVAVMLISTCLASMPISGQTSNKGADRSKRPKRSKYRRQSTPDRGGSTPFPVAATDESGASGASNADKPKDKRTAQTVAVSELPAVSVERDWVDYWTLGLTGGLILVGALGIAAAVATIEKMSAQESLMRSTAIRQLRAYVCVHAVLVRFIGNGGSETFEVQVDIGNSGQTPAYDVQQWIRVFIGEYPLSVDLPEPPEDFAMSSSVIAPKGSASIARGPNNPVRAPIITLGTARRTIYAYGKVRYKDAFGENRTTRYRFYYGGEEAARRVTHPDGYIVGVLRAHNEGNEAD